MKLHKYLVRARANVFPSLVDQFFNGLVPHLELG